MNDKIYKSAGDYIIVLHLLDDSKTNLDRSNVIDNNFAMFRCNKAYVDYIYHKHTKKRIDCISSDWKANFTYTVGSIVESNYDEDNEKVHTYGIHFYLTDKGAMQFNLKMDNINGLYTKYHANGRLERKCNLVNGMIHGIYEQWYDDGAYSVKCSYNYNKLHGPYYIYNQRNKNYNDHCFDEESVRVSCNYSCGKLHGSYQSFHSNGIPSIKCEYNDGLLHGPYFSWHNNGVKYIDCNYDNGYKIGKYIEYHESNNVLMTHDYKEI